MKRKPFNPGPEHLKFELDIPPKKLETSTLSTEEITALGKNPVEAIVEKEDKPEEDEPIKTEIDILSKVDAAKEYDKKYNELVSEIFDQIESNYSSGDMALAEAMRKASLKSGPRPAENINSEVILDTLESKWLTYFKKPTLINMLESVSKLNMANGRKVQGIVHIDNPSSTIKKRESDIYKPIEAEVNFLVSRGILSGDVKDLSVAMFKDFMKDFGGREYGGAIYHPRNASLKETMDSLSGRINKLRQGLKNISNPVDIASTKDFIKDLTAKKKAILSIIAESMTDSEKAEHKAYKARTILIRKLSK